MINSKKNISVLIFVILLFVFFYKSNIIEANIYLVNESKEPLNIVVCIDNDTIYKNIVINGVYERSRIEKKLSIGYHNIYVKNLNDSLVATKGFWVINTTYMVVFFAESKKNIYIEQQYSPFLPD